MQSIIGEPAIIIIGDATTPASCGNSDGTITLSANGGTPGYEFSIDNGFTFQTSGTFSNLIAGNYDVVVKDANGCTSTGSTSVNNTAAPAITTVAGVDLTCYQSNDGQIAITATGGTLPLSYSINNGTSFQGTNAYANLATGSYNIIVQDALGCQANFNISLNEPTQLALANQLINTTWSASNGTIT